MKNLRIIVAIAIVAIMLLVVALPTNAAFEGVTFTVTSNVGNGTEVNPGDEIVYTIKMKNNSGKDYYAPTIMVVAPEQTEITNIEIDQATVADSKLIDGEISVYVGAYLEADSELSFKVTVKVNEDATGEINFANVTDSDENPYGLTLAILVASNVTEDELDNFYDVMENIDDYDTLAAIQAALGNNFYFNIVKDDQSNPIKVQEETEETAEEVVAEENKDELGEKPTKLPKTGMEYSIVTLVVGLMMLALGIKMVI